MYASLENNPVVVSYPDGQPSNSPKNKEEKRYLTNFMYNNRFVTIYTFGDCKIEHCVPELSYKYFGVRLVQELRFYTDINKYDFASVRYYHMTDKIIFDDDKKQLIQLYQDVKHKSRSKSFINPIKQIMQQNVSDLQLYARNAMDSQDAEKMIAELNKIKDRLLAPQNIKYNGK